MKTFKFLFIILAATLVLTSCESESDPEPQPLLVDCFGQDGSGAVELPVVQEGDRVFPVRPEDRLEGKDLLPLGLG